MSQEEMPAWLAEYSRVFRAGKMAAGQALVEQALAAGYEVLVIDPKNPEDWKIMQLQSPFELPTEERTT